MVVNLSGTYTAKNDANGKIIVEMQKLFDFPFAFPFRFSSVFLSVAVIIVISSDVGANLNHSTMQSKCTP